jgi:PKD repeat protein
MRNFCPAFVILALLGTVSVSSAGQGTITGLTVSPPTADVGATITATATGAPSPCGAVFIDWGDGAARTYATASLPVTETHVYKTAGTFSVRFQGQGNCAGEATARVVITAPKPPPAAPRLTAVVLPDPVVEPRRAATITLDGTGPCRLTLDYGDGNNQEITATLPTTVRHTYALPGRYTVVATPAAPCAERRQAALQVGGRPAQRITGIQIDQPAGAPPTERSITMAGSGRCAYTLDFGDGNTETRDATLPEVVRHNYPAAGRYTVVATARPPCTGDMRSTFVVGRDLHGSITAVEVRPQVARAGQPIALTVAGSGTCKIVVDFDDGESRTVTEQLPYRLTYRYAEAGDYEIVVWTDTPCTGGGEALLRVRRR